MQLLYIPKERVDLMRSDRAVVGRIERACRCAVTINNDDTVELRGNAVDEFSASGIVHAFGRGFDIDIACKLLNENYYFKSIDLSQLFESEKRIGQIKARVIGTNGKTKKYIEEVSGARVCIYGKTVSFIGTLDEITEAEAAVSTLIEGGTHRHAYTKMEAEHRRNKADARSPAF